MYKVTLNNNGVEYTIHNSSSDNSKSKLSSGSITTEINSISSFEFTILPNNTGFNRLTPYVSRIIVENELTGEEVFNGRALKVKPKMSNKGAVSKTVVCEDRLGFLCDSIQPYLEEQHWDTDEESSGLEKYLTHLLEIHNEQVDSDKYIFLGNVTAKTLYSDNSCDKGTNYETTWEVIKSKLIDVFGGEIELREENNILYLDYLNEIGEESSTVIELTKNMQSIDETIDYSDVFTRLIPLGAKLTTTDENGNEIETEERLTIASVNNNCIWIDTTKISELGVITKTVEYDDITDASNLLKRANDYIETTEVVTEKNNISVVDLSLIDSSYDELTVGNYYNVKNTLIDLNKQLRITKKNLDICKPTSSTITVGDTGKTLSEITLNKTKDITDILQQITYITTNYAKNTAVTNTYSQLSSLINQTYQEILLLVSETYVTSEDYLEKMAELDIYIDQITAMVSEITSLTEQYATLEVNLNGISEKVASLSDQSSQIANITVALEEIQEQITSITDLTTSDVGTGSINLNDVNESALIYLKIYPTATDISYLYPSDDLYPSNNLFPLSRTLVIKSNEEEVRYTLPCNLLYYDSNTYDEFIYSYETSTCYKIARVGIDESGNKYALDEEIITYYDFELINLAGGDYTIYLLSFSDAMLQARAMVSNLYTDQYVTQAQLTSSLSVLKDEINAGVETQYATLSGDFETLSAELSLQATKISLKLNASDLTSAAIIGLINNRDGTSTALIEASNINLTASDVVNILAGNTINLTSNSIVISSTNFSVTSAGAITATSGTIGGFSISDYNLIGGSGSSCVGMCSTNEQNYAFWAGSSTSSSAPFRVGHDGALTATNANITGSITATSGTFTGTVSGSTISGGTISGATISGNTISGGTISGATITATSGTIGGWKLSSTYLYSSSSTVDSYIYRNRNVIFGGSYGLIKFDADPVRITSASKLIISDYYSCSSMASSSDTISIRAYNGTVHVNSNYGVYINSTQYGTSSSKKTKENIKLLKNTQIDELYEEVKSLKLYSYDYKKKYGGRKNNYGIIIEDFEDGLLGKILHVSGNNEDENYKSYSHEDLSRVNLILIKELIKKVERLEEELNEK